MYFGFALGYLCWKIINNLKFQRTPLSPVPTVITDERFNLLCPQPKHIQQLSDAYSDDLNFFPDGMTISISTGDHSVHE